MTTNATSRLNARPAGSVANTYAPTTDPTTGDYSYVASTPTDADFASLGLSADDVAKINSSQATPDQRTAIYQELERSLGTSGSYQGTTAPVAAPTTASAPSHSSASPSMATASDQLRSTGVPSPQDFLDLGLSQDAVQNLAKQQLTNAQIAELYANLAAARAAGTATAAGNAPSTANTAATGTSTRQVPTPQDFLDLGLTQEQVQRLAQANPSPDELIRLADGLRQSQGQAANAGRAAGTTGIAPQQVPTPQDFLALGLTKAQVQEIAAANPTADELVQLYGTLQAQAQGQSAAGPNGAAAGPPAWSKQWEHKFRELFQQAGVPAAEQQEYLAELKSSGYSEADLQTTYDQSQQTLAAGQPLTKDQLLDLQFKYQVAPQLAGAALTGWLAKKAVDKTRTGLVTKRLQAAVDSGDKQALAEAIAKAQKRKLGRTVLGNMGLGTPGDAQRLSVARSVRALGAGDSALSRNAAAARTMATGTGTEVLESEIKAEAKRLGVSSKGSATDVAARLAKLRGVNAGEGDSAATIMQRYVSSKTGSGAKVAGWTALNAADHARRISGSSAALTKRFGAEVAEKNAANLAKHADLRGAADSTFNIAKRIRLAKAASKVSAGAIGSDMLKASGRTGVAGAMERASFRVAAESAARGGFTKSVGRNLLRSSKGGGIAGVALASAFEVPGLWKSGKQNGVGSKQFSKDAGKAAGHIAGGVGGFIAGAEGGALLGAAVGGPFAWATAPIGGFIGGTVGAMIGSGAAGWIGEKAGGVAHDGYEWLDKHTNGVATAPLKATAESIKETVHVAQDIGSGVAHLAGKLNPFG